MQRKQALWEHITSGPYLEWRLGKTSLRKGHLNKDQKKQYKLVRQRGKKAFPSRGSSLCKGSETFKSQVQSTDRENMSAMRWGRHDPADARRGRFTQSLSCPAKGIKTILPKSNRKTSKRLNWENMITCEDLPGSAGQSLFLNSL